MEEKVTCLRGLVEAGVAAAATPTTIPRTFDEWILRRLGAGIADVFMRPYNYKVWGYPTTAMQCRWLGERVAAADAAAAVENAVRGTVAAGWGPNATFRFPRAGGTGAIWKGVAGLLPPDKLLLGRTVTSVDLEAKRATLSDGETTPMVAPSVSLCVCPLLSCYCDGADPHLPCCLQAPPSPTDL
jgi:protoporphyrinogen oxidase